MTRITHFFHWYSRSRTAFSVHSPLLYSFCSDVLDDDRNYYAFENIEEQRLRLLSSNGYRSLTDLGGTASGHPVTLAESLRRSASPPWKGKFLFRLAKWWGPDAILETGTHLGFATAYMASAREGVPVWTIDQSAQAQDIAQDLWQSLGLAQVNPICRELIPGLEEVNWSHGKKWLVYLDADHRSESVEEVLRYLEVKLQRPYCVVIDDIRWSDDMYRGWKKWSSTGGGAWIDLFQGGLRIADDSFLQPVHMCLIPRKWKPLRMGWI